MPLVTIRQFSALMRQKATITSWTGNDQYGKPTYGAATAVQCALVGDMKLVRDRTGQLVPSRSQLYLMSNMAVQPQDLVTLSTADVGSTMTSLLQPPILSVGRYPFLAGNFCTVIHLT